MAWNQSTAYSLSTTNFEVSENKTNELTMTASYQVQGMKLPFFKKKLNNRISFNLTMSHATLTDQRYSIRRGLVDRIARGDEFVLEDALKGDNISIVTASTRVTVVPRISYQFSNRVSADFTLRYENFLSEDSRQPSSTNIDGGFNVRVSISN
jgi:cell surface protein SprA